jgi:molybdenum cofactor biosynthesis enzyme MoaA
MDRVQALELYDGSGRRELIDPSGRAITYLRVSVTDRCDFRCVYCMAENMSFLPKAEVLSLEELDRLCSAFVARGVRKLRLTGGEPLVRRGIMTLVNSLSRHLHSGQLDELTLTTNGSQLAKYAAELKAAGICRINVSLDTLDAEKFRAITRWGSLDQVLAGIDAAQAAGLKIKINTVALKGVNDDEFPRLLEWAHGRGMDLTLIEVMPLGEIGEGGRLEQYLPLSMVRAGLAERFSLEDIDYQTGGRRAMCASPKPAAGSASSRRSRTISANPAIVCASPAPARFICASARKTPPICADRCALRKPTIFSSPPSTRRFHENPRATISSSIAATAARRWPAT